MVPMSTRLNPPGRIITEAKMAFRNLVACGSSRRWWRGYSTEKDPEEGTKTEEEEGGDHGQFAVSSASVRAEGGLR